MDFLLQTAPSIPRFGRIPVCNRGCNGQSGPAGSLVQSQEMGRGFRGKQKRQREKKLAGSAEETDTSPQPERSWTGFKASFAQSPSVSTAVKMPVCRERSDSAKRRNVSAAHWSCCICCPMGSDEPVMLRTDGSTNSCLFCMSVHRWFSRMTLLCITEYQQIFTHEEVIANDFCSAFIFC